MPQQLDGHHIQQLAHYDKRSHCNMQLDVAVAIFQRTKALLGMGSIAYLHMYVQQAVTCLYDAIGVCA